MNNLQLPVETLPDGSLVVNPLASGGGYATITYMVDQTSGAKTAIISFNGVNQAVASFDALGCQVVSYMSLDLMGSMAVQRSIENIIRYMNSNNLH